MKKYLLIIVVFFLTENIFAQVNSLKIEAFTRGFSKEISLENTTIHYKSWEGTKTKKLVIDSAFKISPMQRDTLQSLAKDIDFSKLSDWKTDTSQGAIDGDCYTTLFINGYKSKYFDYRKGIKEIKPFYQYFLKILNEAALNDIKNPKKK